MKNSVGPKIRQLAGIFFLFAILINSNSCTKDTTLDSPTKVSDPKVTGPGTNEVWIQGSAFSPETISVTAGTTVTWTNKDAMLHTVTSTTGLFDSGNIANNGTYSRQFNTIGSFPYKCLIHSAMTGTVIVK
jgi:plastocyanin